MGTSSNRCIGRYPVPQTSPAREEAKYPTYRCGLPAGHAGAHGPFGGVVDATTDWQRRYIDDLSKRDDFDRFVLFKDEQFPARYGKPGPIVVLWYSLDGKLHADRIGKEKIIRTVSV